MVKPIPNTLRVQRGTRLSPSPPQREAHGPVLPKIVATATTRQLLVLHRRGSVKLSMLQLYAIVDRGQNKGIRVEPHKYRNGKYKVARRKDDRPIQVELVEIESYIKRGYGVRMGNKLKRHPPGLFMPKSIHGWR
jgi:hypothetical protein